MPKFEGKVVHDTSCAFYRHLRLLSVALLGSDHFYAMNLGSALKLYTPSPPILKKSKTCTELDVQKMGAQTKLQTLVNAARRPSKKPCIFEGCPTITNARGGCALSMVREASAKNLIAALIR